MSIVNNEVPNNKIILKRITVDPNNKQQVDNFNKNFIYNHWFNQKVEIILPIKKVGNEENDEENEEKEKQKQKSKGSLLSQVALSGKLIVEGEFTSLFQQQQQQTSSSNINTNQLYYQIETTIDLLLSHDFIDRYIKNGGFNAISQFNFIDSGNVVAFLPDSTVVLNLEKETYQELGLVGKPSLFRNSQRYIIKLDTRSKQFSKDSKSYTRLMWALKDRLSSITLLCYKENKQDNTNKLEPIEFPKGVLVKQLYNQSNQQISKYRLPTLQIINDYLGGGNGGNDNGTIDKLTYCDFINEWIEVIGFASLNIQPDIMDDFELSNSLLSMCTGSPTQCFKASQKGFISNQYIIELITKIKQLIQKGTIEYGCINISGFADTPLSWGSNEHNYLYGGENDQCLLILPNNKYLSSNLVGTFDYYC